MTDNLIHFPRGAEVVSIADVLRSMDAQPAQVTPIEGADRVWKVAKDAKVLSHMVVRTMRTLGYEGVKSPSSKVDLSPIERDALVATVDTLHPRDPNVLIRAFLPNRPEGE